MIKQQQKTVIKTLLWTRECPPPQKKKKKKKFLAKFFFFFWWKSIFFLGLKIFLGSIRALEGPQIDVFSIYQPPKPYIGYNQPQNSAELGGERPSSALYMDRNQREPSSEFESFCAKIPHFRENLKWVVHSWVGREYFWASWHFYNGWIVFYVEKPFFFRKLGLNQFCDWVTRLASVSRSNFVDAIFLDILLRWKYDKTGGGR